MKCISDCLHQSLEFSANLGLFREMVRLVSFGFIIVAIEFIQALGLSLVVLKMGKQDSFEATRVVTSLLAKFKTDFTASVEPLCSKLQRKTATSQEPTETLNS